MQRALHLFISTRSVSLHLRFWKSSFWIYNFKDLCHIVSILHTGKKWFTAIAFELTVLVPTPKHLRFWGKVNYFIGTLCCICVYVCVSTKQVMYFIEFLFIGISDVVSWKATSSLSEPSICSCVSRKATSLPKLCLPSVTVSLLLQKPLFAQTSPGSDSLLEGSDLFLWNSLSSYLHLCQPVYKSYVWYHICK